MRTGIDITRHHIEVLPIEALIATCPLLDIDIDDLDALAVDISATKWVTPILIDSENNVVAGHIRLEAAYVAGINEVPAIRVKYLGNRRTLKYMALDELDLRSPDVSDRSIAKIEPVTDEFLIDAIERLRADISAAVDREPSNEV